MGGRGRKGHRTELSELKRIVRQLKANLLGAEGNRAERSQPLDFPEQF